VKRLTHYAVALILILGTAAIAGVYFGWIPTPYAKSPVPDPAPTSVPTPTPTSTPTPTPTSECVHPTEAPPVSECVQPTEYIRLYLPEDDPGWVLFRKTVEDRTQNEWVAVVKAQRESQCIGAGKVSEASQAVTEMMDSFDAVRGELGSCLQAVLDSTPNGGSVDDLYISRSSNLVMRLLARGEGIVAYYETELVTKINEGAASAREARVPLVMEYREAELAASSNPHAQLLVQMDGEDIARYDVLITALTAAAAQSPDKVRDLKQLLDTIRLYVGVFQRREHLRNLERFRETVEALFTIADDVTAAVEEWVDEQLPELATELDLDADQPTSPPEDSALDHND